MFVIISVLWVVLVITIAYSVKVGNKINIMSSSKLGDHVLERHAVLALSVDSA